MTAERGDLLHHVEQAPAPGPQVIFGFDAVGICTMSIGPGLKLLGLEPGQLVGKNLFDVYTEPSSHESLNRALAGESFTVERDLGERRLSVYYQSIVDGAGKVTGAIGVATDVTEHRRMERAEQASLRRASRLADLSSALNQDVRDLETLLKVAIRSLTTGVAEHGVLWLLTADGDLLEPRAFWALDVHDLRPVPVPDITSPQTLDLDGRAVLRLPLRSRGHLVGLVELSRGAAGPFTDDEVSLAADMAERSGLVIDNALLFLAERHAHEELVAFKALADASTNLIAISDEENRFRYVNPSVRRQGFTVVESDIWETVTAHLAEPAAAELRRELVSTGRWSGDLEVTVGGETRIVHLDAFDLPHPETGAHLGSAWIAQDFTDLRATEAALRAAVSDIEQFKALVEASPDFIAIAALDGTVTYVNPRGRELIGMDPSVDVTTTNVTDYLPPGGEDLDLWEEVRETVAATGHWEGESTLRNHRGGPPIRVATSSFLIRGAEDGRPIAMATVERDITERLAAEAALRDMAAQREALLTHLVDAQDAERAQIAADVHDDPVQALAAVDLRLGLLRRRLRERAPDLLDFLEPLQASVSGATDRLRALLFDLEPPDLQHGLAGALKRAAEEVFDGTPTRWRVEGEDEPAMPEATRAIAYRIAKEALVNVLKHAAAEQVEVTVAGRDGGVEVSVADDGVGLDATKSETPPGRHRGLMTMEERAIVAGGRCTVRNRRDRGTRVTLWLPGPGGAE